MRLHKPTESICVTHWEEICTGVRISNRPTHTVSRIHPLFSPNWRLVLCTWTRERCNL